MASHLARGRAQIKATLSIYRSVENAPRSEMLGGLVPPQKSMAPGTGRSSEQEIDHQSLTMVEREMRDNKCRSRSTPNAQASTRNLSRIDTASFVFMPKRV
jgi:hypothetical protein